MQKHSVLLKEKLCEGCTNCVKKCPTKAIRVHQGKATIKEELCIDCAECIRTCAYHAKYSRTNTFLELADYDYPVILIPPSFYGQFDGIKPEEIHRALYKIGFKEVRDVAVAAEALSWKTKTYLKDNPGMFISSSCPVVVRMIKILYPELLGHLLKLKAPVEIMAESIKTELREKGLAEEDTALFFITPCPAKNTTIFNPMGIEKSFLDKSIAVDLVYQEILKVLDEEVNSNDDKELITNSTHSDAIDRDKITPIPYKGFSWGQSEGELSLLDDDLSKRTLSVSGIHNVKDLLEELSRNNVKGIKYFELAACNQGCVGGVFNVANPYQAKHNILKLLDEGKNMIEQDFSKYNYDLTKDLKAIQIDRLDSNMEKAMKKLIQLEKEIDLLPGLDCAACGAPDCKTLAEDIVNGRGKRSDCIFVLRQQVEDLADKMSELAHALPPVMRNRK
ncbi:[Fe-Fe] hydrogenase large subunit C-terminal domain-containing protein [Natronospora cellulosivora (SeqCode)]